METKLTRRQAAIIGAYTGVLCGPFSDMHGYIDSLPGFKGIGIAALGVKEVADKVTAASAADFMSLCPDANCP